MKHDLREATRFLSANPGFTAVIVLTLGLAIGVNTTIFSVLHGVLLRPLPYADPDRLVTVWESNPSQGLDRSQVSAATYLDWRERTRAFGAMGVYRYRGFTLTGDGEPQRLATVDLSPVLRSCRRWHGGHRKSLNDETPFRVIFAGPCRPQAAVTGHPRRIP